MRSKPPRWAIRNCSEPEDDTDTIAASALRDKLASSVARFADRRDDWSVFGFETALDPKFARAQRRYLGASGSVDHNDRRGWIRRPPSPSVGQAGNAHRARADPAWRSVTAPLSPWHDAVLHGV